MSTRPIDDPQVLAAMKAALAWLASRARYAEVRLVDERGEALELRDGRPENISRSRSTGVGIRVLGSKTWGFSCTPTLTEGAMVRAAEEALAVAEASSRAALKMALFPERNACVGRYETALAEDPFSVSLEEKLGTLDKPVRALLAKGSLVRSARGWLNAERVEKRLLTTEGTDVAQSMTYGAYGVSAIAIAEDGAPLTRSFPTFNGGDGFQGGYERVRERNAGLAREVDRVADELAALTKAPICPEGPRDLILESSQVGLQVHESCGHPTELDRAFGTEISLAGGSFMQPALLDKLRYGSDHVTLTCDAITPGGNGTFGWDDEGTPAAKHTLVDRGRFVDYLSSRETAAQLGRESTGTMRADGWNRTPLIRMLNVSLAPGQGTLDALIADTKDGVLMATDRSWSIDDLRENFHFSCEIGWEIKHGKKTRILRAPSYGGTTPAFWGSCDAVCGPEEHQLWGVRNCGKGDPMQLMQVGHGASPARFKNVSIGSGGAK